MYDSAAVWRIHVYTKEITLGTFYFFLSGKGTELGKGVQEFVSLWFCSSITCVKKREFDSVISHLVMGTHSEGLPEGGVCD